MISQSFMLVIFIQHLNATVVIDYCYSSLLFLVLLCCTACSIPSIAEIRGRALSFYLGNQIFDVVSAAFHAKGILL